MNRNITEFFKIPESIIIRFFGGIWYRLLVNAENRALLKDRIPQQPLNTEPREEVIIASMTSYPARIPFVHLAIKSLMLQSYKPDRIILWLAEEQFPDKTLPDELTALTAHGLEIIWMHDIYGHKKYFYPVMNQKENEVVITFDDDIIYPIRCIERLMKTHKAFPGCLVCERGQTINRDNLKNPGRWITLSDVGVKTPTYSMNPSPGGGCLIPFGAFYKDAQNEEIIRKLAYKNDDLWYMFMCAQNGTRMIKTRKYHRSFTTVAGSQVEQMATENVLGNKNVEIMEGLIAAYPQAWERICTDKD